MYTYVCMYIYGGGNYEEEILRMKGGPEGTYS